jgi:hypothetical protein
MQLCLVPAEGNCPRDGYEEDSVPVVIASKMTMTLRSLLSALREPPR